MTEDEARTKWCPFARISDADDATVNRAYVGNAPHPGTLCMASDCMAWRWSSFTEGYCGLAPLSEYR